MKALQKILLVFLLSFISNGLSAQISDKIKEITRKCEEKMNNPKGMDISMEVKVLMLKTHIRTLYKGEKAFMTSSVKMLGKSVTMEMGFDGTQEWEYDSATDSLIITKTTKKSDKENDLDVLDFDLPSEYKTAKMKEKNGVYEITFTNPINKDVPSKSVMRINQNNYYLSEMQMGSGIKSITIKINKIKAGHVDDSVFVLDTKKYPTAKIRRK